jgi:hypothetical protein
MSAPDRTDFRAVLRAELVAAAARPAPARRARPSLPRVGWIATAAVAAAAAVLAVVVLGRHQAPAPHPAKRAQLPGRPLFGGSLERGVRYRSRALVPAVSFVAGGLPWAASEAGRPDILALTSGPAGYQPKLHPPLYFLDFVRIPRVLDPASGAAARVPADLAAWLRAHPDLRAGASRRVTVAGLPATQLDFTVVRRPARQDPYCREHFRLRCTALAPNLSLIAGARARALVVRSGPEPLVVVQSAVGPARFDRLLTGAAPVLDSLRIAP